MRPMQMSPEGKRKLRNAEALRLAAYLDANGKWTIGFGHKILPSELGLYVHLGKHLTPDEANALFEKDLATKCGALNDALNGTPVVLNQNQYDALVMFIYNIGVGNWKGSTACRDLRANHPELLPHEMKRWVHDDDGNVIQGLVNRRQHEIDLFNTPMQ